MKKIVIVLMITFVFGWVLIANAEEPIYRKKTNSPKRDGERIYDLPNATIYGDADGNIIFDLNNIDYYRYGGAKVTLKGLLDIIVRERQERFINELKQILRGK